MEHDAAIIEVALNEAAGRVPNPHVPFGPEECAQDARHCRDAGAAIVHWHARDPDGASRLGDVELSAAAFDEMRTDGVLAYPSYPVDASVPHAERLAHVWALGEHHGLELAPVDIGSVTVVVWDDRSHDFVGIDALRALGVIDNPLPFVLDGLERARELGMVPTLGAFDVGFTRTMALLARSGRVRQPVLHKIFLSGALALGPEPVEDALDWHLRQIPDDLDVEWIAVPYAIGDPTLVERLCRHALARGGGIRVGLGDNPGAEPSATNAELVERAVTWARDSGRPVASSDDVRRRVGLALRTDG